MLWLLLWVNGLGTLYGFQWYGWQIVKTIQEEALWLVFFVPDSPTASLFFTAAIAYLLIDHYILKYKATNTHKSFLRSVIEAFAVITSIKYGIWAVFMIIFGAMEGSSLQWQHWMLIVSHLGMALEAVIFARFFGFKWIHIIIVGFWTFINDFIDYTFGVYPALPKVLDPHLNLIRFITICLSILSIYYAFVSIKLRKKLSLV